jgi:hypothetical protein
VSSACLFLFILLSTQSGNFWIHPRFVFYRLKNLDIMSSENINLNCEAEMRNRGYLKLLSYLDLQRIFTTNLCQVPVSRQKKIKPDALPLS